MTRLRGRAPKGKRLVAGIPHNHWKTTTFIAGLRLTGMVAPMVLDGAIDRDAIPHPLIRTTRMLQQSLGSNI